MADPWIGMILDGTKTWEMRSKITNQRGPIALIRKGSGQIVGTATLANCQAPLDPDAYAAVEDRHRIPPANQPWAVANGYLISWVLEYARPLLRPVPYRHPSGAVTWVVLDDAVARAVMDQGQDTRPKAAVSPSTLPENAGVPTGEAFRADVRSVELTAGNIANGHIYLRGILNFFPHDAVGGSDKTQRAERSVSVTFEGTGTHITDITGPDRLKRPGRSNHCFFRERGPVRRFFALHEAMDGDVVDISRTGSHAYTVSFRSRNRDA